MYTSATRFPYGARTSARKLCSAPIYRLPIVWVAAALFAASIAGCIVTIVLALEQPDAALPNVGDRLLSVPAAHAKDPS